MASLAAVFGTCKLHDMSKLQNEMSCKDGTLFCLLFITDGNTGNACILYNYLSQGKYLIHICVVRNSEVSDVHDSALQFVCCLLVGCLTPQLRASVSQGRICSDNFTCCLR